MKYLLLGLLFLSCGGELPKDCGDGILQSGEVCEMGLEKPCGDEFRTTDGVMVCYDCHSWDIEKCIREN